MAKKVKFPLKMADQTQVRTLEELKEHFDLTSVLGYYVDGRLIEWLADRYFETEAEKVKALDPKASDFNHRLCKIFGVSYSDNEAAGVDLTDISDKSKRRERLKEFTADDKILAAADRVAFTQEDLAALLDNDVKEIYLCGKQFKIPGSKTGVTYIGVNNPKVDVQYGYATKEIRFQNVDFGIDDNNDFPFSLTSFIELCNISIDTDMTEQLALEKVKEDGWNLIEVPEALWTEALCVEAVKQNCMMLAFVPKSLRPQVLHHTNPFNKTDMTEQFVLEKVKEDGNTLAFMPKAFLTQALCLEAVKENGLALAFVPKEFRTEDLCFEAVKQVGMALLFMPQAILTEAFCLEAINQNSDALLFVPRAMKTESLYRVEIEKDPSAVQYVPPEVPWAEALYRVAIEKDPLAVKYVPPEVPWAEAICLEAVKIENMAHNYMPEKLRTEAVYLEAVKQGCLLNFVPEEMRTEAICIEGVKQISWYIDYVPKHLKARVKAAVDQS